MAKWYRNKVAVITGAADGLGRALAIELYKQGCDLALLDVNLAGLAQIKKDLGVAAKITIHKADVSDEDELVAARNEILVMHGQVDIFINNAGISASQPFAQMDTNTFRQVIETNFMGAVLCAKHFLPLLQKRKDSRLVNISSDFALMGFPGKSAYGASKAALSAFSNTLQTELAATRVKVCLVIPPPMDTGIVKQGPHIDDEKKRAEAAFLRRHGMPVGRVARRIAANIKRGKKRIVIGAMTYWIDMVSRLFPSVVHNLISRYKKKFDFV